VYFSRFILFYFFGYHVMVNKVIYCVRWGRKL